MRGNFVLLIFGCVSAMALLPSTSARSTSQSIHQACPGRSIIGGSVSSSGYVTCLFGYAYTAPPAGTTRRCSPTGRWTGTATCKPCSLYTRHGIKSLHVCRTGYYFDQWAYRTATSKAQCFCIPCPAQTIRGGNVSASGQVTCQAGYYYSPPPAGSKTGCDTFGSWTGVASCVECNKAIPGGDVSPSGVVSCKPGYISMPPSDGSTPQCSSTGVWTGIASCHPPTTCPGHAITNGNVSATGHVTCQAGHSYTRAAAGTTPHCRGGRWVGIASCNSCNRAIVGGTVSTRGNVKCHSGYYRSPPSQSVLPLCSASGKWAGIASCQPCRAHSITGGSVSVTGVVTCQSGYRHIRPQVGTRSHCSSERWYGIGFCLKCKSHAITGGNVTTGGVVTCQTGYRYSPPPAGQSILCSDNGTWIGIGSCVLSCNDEISGGRVSPTGHVTCKSGYYYSAPSRGVAPQCLPSGRWTGLASCNACVRAIPDGNVSETGHVTCNTGYYSSAAPDRTPQCLSTGWSLLASCHPCTRYTIPGGRVSATGQVTCDTAYYYVHPYQVPKCGAPGKWSGLGSCHRCNSFINNGFVLTSGQVRCHPGYYPTHNDSGKCSAPNHWTGIASCRPCPSHAIANGKVSAAGRVTCQAGYYHSPPLSGTTSNCPGGRWTGIASCIPLYCSSYAIPGGNISATGVLTCQVGYEPIPHRGATGTCTVGGKWSGVTCHPCKSAWIQGGLVNRDGSVSCYRGFFHSPAPKGTKLECPSRKWTGLASCHACGAKAVHNGYIASGGLVSCNLGYMISTPMLTCSAPGIWTPSGPPCSRCQSHAIPGGKVSPAGDVTCHAGYYSTPPLKSEYVSRNCLNGTWTGIAACNACKQANIFGGTISPPGNVTCKPGYSIRLTDSKTPPQCVSPGRFIGVSCYRHFTPFSVHLQAALYKVGGALAYHAPRGYPVSFQVANSLCHTHIPGIEYLDKLGVRQQLQRLVNHIGQELLLSTVNIFFQRNSNPKVPLIITGHVNKSTLHHQPAPPGTEAFAVCVRANSPFTAFSVRLPHPFDMLGFHIPYGNTNTFQGASRTCGTSIPGIEHLDKDSNGVRPQVQQVVNSIGKQLHLSTVNIFFQRNNHPIVPVIITGQVNKAPSTLQHQPAPPGTKAFIVCVRPYQ